MWACSNVVNLQTDLEEAKAQEIAKLQETLHDMQLQVEEAKAMVVKEREAARKAIEEAPPVVKETPVLVEDTEKINSLTAEVEQLKVWWQLIFHWAFSLTTTVSAPHLANPTIKPRCYSGRGGGFYP